MAFLLYPVHSLMAVVLVVVSAWLVFLMMLAAASALARRRPPGNPVSRGLRLAVLVPAHDEELMIQTAIAGIIASDYPRDRFDLFVVADNCTDRTAELARAGGAKVLERRDPERRGKGYALQLGLQHILQREPGYDGVVFIDADSRMAPDFLAWAAQSLAEGRQVIQGRYEVGDPDRTWFTRLTHLGFCLKNFYQYQGLGRLGLSPPLVGSGMIIATEVLIRHGWPSVSLTEDLDFSIRLLGQGQVIHYLHQARTAQYMPPTPAAAKVQRERWSAGQAQALRGGLARLALRGVRRLDFAVLVQALYLAAPPLSVFPLLAGAGLVWFAAAGGAWYMILWAALALAGFMAYFTLSLSVTGWRRVYVVSLLTLPLYVVWRVLVHILSLLPRGSRGRTWQPTKRV